jgi:hypothetical protein
VSKKTLTDELQSVLLDHSFDAPEPTPTIDKILLATVGSAAAGSAGADPNARRSRRLRPTRWRPTTALVGIAASVAALVIGAAIVNTARHGTTADTAAKNASPAIAQASGGPIAPDARSNGAPRENFVPGRTPACPAGQSRVPTVTPYDQQNLAAPITIVTTDCLLGTGLRTGSEVSVYRGTGADALVANLITRAERLDVDYISVVGNRIRIQAVSHDPTTSGVPVGSIVSIDFATADSGNTFSGAGGAMKVVAKPCTGSTMKLSVIAGKIGSVGNGHRTSAILAFENTGVLPCAMEGYPTIAPLGAGPSRPSSGPVRTTLRGPLGGLSRSPAAPIIQLTPGGTASALIEATDGANVDGARSCPTATGFLVGLPAAGTVGTVAYRMPLCDAQIHPLVAGSTGAG